MSKLLVALALSVVACGGNKQPPPSEPVPQEPAPAEPSAPMSPDECTAKGGEVRGDIGDGQIQCAEGEENLGRVELGIEGSICCARPATTP